MKYWSLREELYDIFHQWPLIILYFAVGCLLGWGASSLLPTSYRATSQIFVSLNPYRAYTDSNFVALAKPKYSNIDDYKNWQMAELESLIFLDEVLEKTLEELQRTDPYWERMDVNQFGEMLDAEWRSAGAWSLIAQGVNPELVESAVRAWSQVALKSVSDANQAALRTFMIDEELKGTIEDRIAAESRLRTINIVSDELGKWKQNTQKSASKQPLELNDRWYLQSLAATAADFSPGWLALLDGLPSETAPASAYTDWIVQILAFMEREALVLEGETTALKEQQALLEDQYQLVFQQSKAISPNLVVEELKQLPTKSLRPSPVFALIGGIIGLFVYLLVRLVKITRTVDKK